jgi:hypothetical protein
VNWFKWIAVTLVFIGVSGLWVKAHYARQPWHHYYPCNMMIVDYGNGDIYIVNTAHTKKYGDIYGSSQLFHHREDAEKGMLRIMATSTCTHEASE